jgi:hypothetical protein
MDELILRKFVCVCNLLMLDYILMLDIFMLDCLCLASINKGNSAEIFNFAIHKFYNHFVFTNYGVIVL